MKQEGLQRGTTSIPARRPAAIVQSVWQKCFDFLPSKRIAVEPVDEALTCDAGLLPIREFDERLGLTAQFVGALGDGRAARQVVHTLAEMARSRIYGILAHYEDQNDHDTLRSDPVFKLLAAGSPPHLLHITQTQNDMNNPGQSAAISAPCDRVRRRRCPSARWWARASAAHRPSGRAPIRRRDWRLGRRSVWAR